MMITSIVKRGDFVIWKDDAHIYNVQLKDIRLISKLYFAGEYNILIETYQPEIHYKIKIEKKFAEGLKEAEKILDTFMMVLSEEKDYSVFPV